MAKAAPKSKPARKLTASKAKVLPTSLVTFLLDRSQSMESCRDATIEAFNGYLSGLQAEKEAKIDLTFLQFDTISLDKVHVSVPVKDALPLNRSTYQPRGGTPLIDASVKTINAVATSLTQRDDKPKVIVCIQTDGEENASTEHTWEELQGLIKSKQAEGWEFNFMGAGIDAYQQGSRMGISMANTVSYDHRDRHATRSAFVAASANAASFSSGRSANTAYSVQQKVASGDRFDPAIADALRDKILAARTTALQPSVQPVSAPLDLTTSTPMASAPPRRRSVVPDIKL